MATPEAAVTRPAAPYEPVLCSTSSTVPMPSIAMGWRARKPGSTNRQAPGVRSKSP